MGDTPDFRVFLNVLCKNVPQQMLMLVYLFALGLTLSLPVAPLDSAPVCGQLPISSTSISLLPFPETFSVAWEFFSVSVTCSLEIIRISALQGHPGASVRDRNQ